ncbi:sigma-70 family RNA polymerase sigma factor [Pseudomonas sp. X10]
MESQEQESAWAMAMRKERSGDRSAYEHFLRELSVHLRRTVRYRLSTFGLNSAEAEDVVQDVLIAIHTRRNQWDPERPLLPWLNAIARYKIIDAARRLRKEARGRVDIDDEQWSSLQAFDQNSLATSSVDVEGLLSELPPAQQSVARAIGVDGASPREAATQLGMKEGAVRVAFHRALKRLMATAKG